MAEEFTQEERSQFEALIEAGKGLLVEPKYARLVEKFQKELSIENAIFMVIASLDGSIQFADYAGKLLDEVKIEGYRQGCIDAASRIGNQLGHLGLEPEENTAPSGSYDTGDALTKTVAENLGGEDYDQETEPYPLYVYDSRIPYEGKTDEERAKLAEGADIVLDEDGNVVKFRFGTLEEGQAILDASGPPLTCGDPDCACAQVVALEA